MNNSIYSVVFLGPERRPPKHTFLGGKGIEWARWKAQEGTTRALTNPHRTFFGNFSHDIMEKLGDVPYVIPEMHTRVGSR